MAGRRRALAAFDARRWILQQIALGWRLAAGGARPSAMRVRAARPGRANSMPGSRSSPGELDRPDFVALYGGVYEHSPWIAEAVADGGLAPGLGGADGLHRAM